MPYEIFMNIGNYQGKDLSNYEVSNLGNIRNAKTKKVLKTRIHVTNTGYTEVEISLSDTNHKKHTIAVARLVISTFKANPENKSTVNHRNEDPTDNRLNNLEWATPKENNEHGTHTEKISNANKIKIKCIELDKIFDSAKDAALYLNKKNGRSHITACCKGRQKSAFGYTWKYVNPKEQITVTNKPIFNINTNTKYSNAKEAVKAYGKTKTDYIYKACRSGNTFCNCQWCFYEPDMENWDANEFLFIWD